MSFNVCSKERVCIRELPNGEREEVRAPAGWEHFACVPREKILTTIYLQRVAALMTDISRLGAFCQVPSGYPPGTLQAKDTCNDLLH